jgi:hypothetical protein
MQGILAILQSRSFASPPHKKKFKTAILPVVLYGWSLTLREEHRLTVFENSVLRILGPKREDD